MGHPCESRILGKIDAEEIVIGQGVLVEEGVLITGKNGRASRVVLGDFCTIGRETKILALNSGSGTTANCTPTPSPTARSPCRSAETAGSGETPCWTPWVGL